MRKNEGGKGGRRREKHEVLITDPKVTKLSVNEGQKIKVKMEGNKDIGQGKERTLNSGPDLTIILWFIFFFKIFLRFL